MAAQSELYITPEEYLAWERQAETKSEYWNGRIYAMAGGSTAHNTIIPNLNASLVVRLRKRPCRVLSSDTRVKVAPTGLYTYPDVTVVCGKLEFDEKRKDNLLNPTVIFEVLSPSTAAYDRGTKFDHYRTLESLTDYLLVFQDKTTIHHYVRQADDRWLLTVYHGLDTVARIDSIDCELPLAEVYDKVELEQEDRASVTLSVLKERQVVYAVEPGLLAAQGSDPTWEPLPRPGYPH